MPLVAGIRFNAAGKVYYFAPNGFEDLKVGEYVIVETARGEEAGKVVISPHQVSDEAIVEIGTQGEEVPDLVLRGLAVIAGSGQGRRD